MFEDLASSIYCPISVGLWRGVRCLDTRSVPEMVRDIAAEQSVSGAKYFPKLILFQNQVTHNL